MDERRDKCPECGQTRVELLVHPGQFYCQSCGVAGPGDLVRLLDTLVTGKRLKGVGLPVESDPRGTDATLDDVPL